MIDPNILLQSKPVEVEGPLDQGLKAQNLRNLGTENQLRQGQVALQPGQLRQQAADLAATQQENQARQNALDNQAATNAAIAKSIKPGPDGTPTIDHTGVVSNLIAAGKGQAALAYQTHATAIQTGVTALQEAQQKLNSQHVQTFASAANAVTDAPAGAKGAIYHMFLQSGVANQQIHPGEWPPEYDPSLDDKLKAAGSLGITSEQRSVNQRADKGAQTQADRTKVLEDAEAERETRDENMRVHQEATDRTNARNADTQSRRADTYQNHVDDLARGIGPDGKPLTPGQKGVQGRFDQKELDNGRKQLDALHQLRSALGGALATENGSNFVDPKSGRIATQPMDDGVRATYQQQFQNATNEGVRLMKKFGWANEFGDSKDVTTAPAAGGAEPGKPASVAEGTIIKSRTNPKDRRVMKGGRWVPLP